MGDGVPYCSNGHSYNPSPTWALPFSQYLPIHQSQQQLSLPLVKILCLGSVSPSLNVLFLSTFCVQNEIYSGAFQIFCIVFPQCNHPVSPYFQFLASLQKCNWSLNLVRPDNAPRQSFKNEICKSLTYSYNVKRLVFKMSPYKIFQASLLFLPQSQANIPVRQIFVRQMKHWGL